MSDLSHGCLVLTALVTVGAGVSGGAAAQEPDASDAPPRSERGDASAILEALDAYTGHWRSDEKIDRRGNAFHFAYGLRWLDSARTVARMRITRVGDADTSVVFEGFKGLDSDRGSVFYFAVSPAGRGALGDVRLEGSDLVTLYEGWSPEGDRVWIRDAFTPVENGTFVSRTFLRDAPGAAWRQIAEDRWRRQADTRASNAFEPPLGRPEFVELLEEVGPGRVIRPDRQPGTRAGPVSRGVAAHTPRSFPGW